MSRICVRVTMPLPKMKFLWPGVNSPASTLFISVANSCVFLTAHVKSLSSLTLTEAVCSDFTPALCQLPFRPSHQTCQPQYLSTLRAFSELTLLFFSSFSVYQLSSAFLPTFLGLCHADYKCSFILKRLLPTFQGPVSNRQVLPTCPDFTCGAE